VQEKLVKTKRYRKLMNFPTAMKILVTGADGFIGSHLTEALVLAGYDVRAFVLYNSFNSWGWLDHYDKGVKGKFEVLQVGSREALGGS
jgi:nucleoside-diphosphate-sugar epimerase